MDISPSPDAPSVPAEPVAGQWVFVPAGSPWPARPPRRDVAGRAGLFVGGYFALGFVQWVFWNLTQPFTGSARVGYLPVAGLAALFSAGLLFLAARTRGRDIEPLGIMGALGAAGYIAYGAGSVLYSTGVEGKGLFWGVVAVTLPAAVAILLWLPHPILGVNVGIAVVAAVVAVRLPDDGVSLVAGKAFLIGFILLALALVVDVRTRSRAGSALHYFAVIAFAVGKIATYAAIGGAAGLAAVASIAVLELLVAIVDHRRSWAYSAWLTFELVGVGLLGLLFGGAGDDGRLFGFVGPFIIVGAILVQRQQHRLRAQILAALPPHVAERLPA